MATLIQEQVDAAGQTAKLVERVRLAKVDCNAAAAATAAPAGTAATTAGIAGVEHISDTTSWDGLHVKGGHVCLQPCLYAWKDSGDKKPFMQRESTTSSVPSVSTEEDPELTSISSEEASVAELSSDMNPAKLGSTAVAVAAGVANSSDELTCPCLPCNRHSLTSECKHGKRPSPKPSPVRFMSSNDGASLALSVHDADCSMDHIPATPRAFCSFGGLPRQATSKSARQRLVLSPVRQPLHGACAVSFDPASLTLLLPKSPKGHSRRLVPLAHEPLLAPEHTLSSRSRLNHLELPLQYLHSKVKCHSEPLVHRSPRKLVRRRAVSEHHAPATPDYALDKILGGQSARGWLGDSFSLPDRL